MLDAITSENRALLSEETAIIFPDETVRKFVAWGLNLFEKAEVKEAYSKWHQETYGCPPDDNTPLIVSESEPNT